MTDPKPTDRDTRIDEAVAEFLRAEQAGTPLDADTWLSSHPDLRPELDRFLAARAFVRAEVADALAGWQDEAGGFAPESEVGEMRIVRLIAIGGMGRVYAAVQPRLDRRVAVKTVRLTGTALDPQLRHWFQDEMRTVGRLAHDHVVPVFQAGEQDGVPYLVMPLMAGTLRDRMAAGPLPPAEAAAVLGAVARAVEYAHGERVLHRDIKPSNVLFDARGRPHLGDFGLATLLATLDPSGSARVGTPAYMAPEQFDGRADLVSERTDVYGLGAVLYECLTGRPPLPADASVWTPPDPPAKYRPEVDRTLEAVCRRCLMRDPAARYSSAEAVAADLERYLRPPSRRRFLAAGLGLAATAAGVWWLRLPPPAPPAPDPDQAARDERYQELISGVRNRAQTRPMGWTWANREAISTADGIDTRHKDVVELRSELARTFAHPDVREVGTIAPGPRYEVAAFRPGTSGKQVALGHHHRDKVGDPIRVDLFDRTGNQVVRTWQLSSRVDWELRRGRADGVRGLAFAPDGRWLYVGTRSGGVYAIDVAVPAAPPGLIRQEQEAVKHLYPAADGRTLISVSQDGFACRWAVGSWAKLAELSFRAEQPFGWGTRGGYLPATGDYLFFSHSHPTEALPPAVTRFPGELEAPLTETVHGRALVAPAGHPTAPVWAVDAGVVRLVSADDLGDGRVPADTPTLRTGFGEHPERTGFTPDGAILYAGTDGARPEVRFTRMVPIGSSLPSKPLTTMTPMFMISRRYVTYGPPKP